MIARIGQYWQRVFKPDELDTRVRAALVATLYQSPSSLIVGALCGILTSLYIVSSAPTPLVTLATKIVVIVGTLRIVTNLALARRADFTGRWLWFERIYELGAWSYACALGLLGAATISGDVPGELVVIAVATAIGYGGGISARNAGRPMIAIGQTMLSSLPIAVASALSDVTAYHVLAFAILLFVTAMFGITVKTFEVIRASFERAQRHEDIARDMKYFATTDAVTRLMNRTGLNAALEEELSHLENTPVAVFWLDLDRFKEVNDTLGHPVGDCVLQAVSDRLRALAHSNDLVCRFGGDEFIVVRWGEGAINTEAFARAALAAIAQPIWLEQGSINVTASMGIAVAPEDGVTGDSLMKRADMALYHSKLNGRAVFSFYRADMAQELLRRKELETELRDAVANHELAIHYQPIIDLASGEIVAMEALVRWFHPIRGALAPDEFIPIAEQTGLIITIGNWIVTEACKAAAAWAPHIPVCVNVSPVQMRAPGAALGFVNALRHAKIDGRRLELEVTESVFLDENEHIASFIKSVEAEGVRMTIDDFGTGYSSLAYLHRYEFCKIKIDRSFVSGQLSDTKAVAIVRAVARLARDLDMQIIAEGIESQGDAARMVEAGCTHGQGYYFSAGVPLDQALSLLSPAKGEGSKVA